MRIVILVCALLAAVLIGALAGHRYWPGDEPSKLVSADRQILYWVAPMDSNFRRSEPGKSPMGMDLVPVYADDVRDDEAGVVEIEPHVVNNLGIRTAVVERGTLTRQFETIGFVEVNEETVHHIHTRVEGWIEDMTVKSVGQRVSKGQTLFELYAPTLIAAQEEYLTAVRTGNRALIDASAARLKSLGLDQSRLKALRNSGRTVERVPVRAARDGIVEILNVRAGMYVQPSTTVMSLYSLETVWLIAELFERDRAWLFEGSKITASIDSIPDQTWGGAVDYIYPDLDPVARTVRARLTLDNPGEVLRPNMFATVSVSGASLPDVLHIPREAIIRGAQRNRVVVALGNGRYESRFVESGLETATRVQVHSGLAENDKVVVSGQFLIDSESNIATDLARAGQYGDDR